ncbi:acyltransferase family protein [Paenibacillus peoriae]|uniref:acyltransferase family protein n=1 Tax=Paenibacillus peoriae TaxID=59893 RepID=UPI00026C6593|nr:acyltransferase family protein [Paenibacillus peoriae]MEC0184349.1 acyltransferase family protein [Paenibacillus peoriae]
MKKEKDTYWNILKGLAIIAVVVGHAGAPVVEYVYMYHLALFFFISGYWYNDKHSSTPAVFIGKRIKSLYLPYILYNLLFLTLHNIFFKIGFFTDVNTDIPGIYPTRLYDQETVVPIINDIISLKTLDQLGAATWFYIALLVVSVLFCTTRYVSLRWFKNPNIATVIITLSLYYLGFVLNSEQIKLAFFLDISLIVTIVFLIGFLIRYYNVKINYNWWISSICLAILYFSLQKFGHVEMSQRQFINPIMFLICSFSGIYINMYIGKLIIKTRFLARMFSYIGEHSASIMVFHLLIFKLINVIYVKIHSLPLYYVAKFPLVYGAHGWWIVYSFFGVATPVGVIYLINIIIDNIVLLRYRSNNVRASE